MTRRMIHVGATVAALLWAACTHRPPPSAPASAAGGATYGDASAAVPPAGDEPVPPAGVEPVSPDGDPCGY